MSKFAIFLKNYNAALKSLSSSKQADPVLVCGYSSYFFNRFQIDLANVCRDRSLVIKRYENLNQVLDAQDLENGIDLFGESSLYFVKIKAWAAAQAKTLDSLLKNFHSSLVILVEKPVTAKALGSVAKGLNLNVLELSDPWPSEVPDFIRWFCEKLELKLSRPIIALLADILGSDLLKLDNELRQLAMLCGGSATQEFDQSLIDKNYLRTLTDKNVFNLQNLLAQMNTPALHQQLALLLEQGESSHGILAVLSRCYDAALASASHSAFQKTAMKKSYASPMTQKKYNQIASSYSEGQLLGFYKKCQVADLELKGGQKPAFFALRDTLPLA